MRVLVTHAYSADNAGDGLLVEETLTVLREAFVSPRITLAASYPESFDGFGLDRVVSSQPTRRGYARDYLTVLRHMEDYDLVVAVGGGYLRAGHWTEFAKMAAVHGPQLLAASRTRSPVIYMPQSIGPLRSLARPVLRRMLRRVDIVISRDDRTVPELSLPNVTRMHDLGLLTVASRTRRIAPAGARTVISIRSVRGRVPDAVQSLVDQVGKFDGFVQSVVGSNDDSSAVNDLGPERVLSREELLNDAGEARVIVAVRLHGAIMALAAGHRVIHLAYERKGFAAFSDLGLGAYVHNYFDFDAAMVADQLRELRDAGDAYELALAERRPALLRDRAELIKRVRATAHR